MSTINTTPKIIHDIRVAAHFNDSLRLCLYNIAQDCLRGANDLADGKTQEILGKMFQEHSFRLRATWHLSSGEDTTFKDWFDLMQEMSVAPVKGMVE